MLSHPVAEISQELSLCNLKVRTKFPLKNWVSRPSECSAKEIDIFEIQNKKTEFKMPQGLAITHIKKQPGV